MTRSDPVLYVVATGSPATRRLPTFVRAVIDAGWQPCVATSQMGSRWVDSDELARLTGYPVRTAYKQPHEPDVFPPADAYVVAPATFNTVNKLANGITDSLAVGLVVEGVGFGRPAIVAPWLNRALAQAGSYRRSIDWLAQDGYQLVMTDRTLPGSSLPEPPEEEFPWVQVLDTLGKVRSELIAHKGRFGERSTG